MGGINWGACGPCSSLTLWAGCWAAAASIWSRIVFTLWWALQLCFCGIPGLGAFGRQETLCQGLSLWERWICEAKTERASSLKQKAPVILQLFCRSLNYRFRQAQPTRSGRVSVSSEQWGCAGPSVVLGHGAHHIADDLADGGAVLGQVGLAAARVGEQDLPIWPTTSVAAAAAEHCCCSGNPASWRPCRCFWAAKLQLRMPRVCSTPR